MECPFDQMNTSISLGATRWRPEVLTVKGVIVSGDGVVLGAFGWVARHNSVFDPPSLPVAAHSEVASRALRDRVIPPILFPLAGVLIEGPRVAGAATGCLVSCRSSVVA